MGQTIKSAYGTYPEEGFGTGRNVALWFILRHRTRVYLAGNDWWVFARSIYIHGFGKSWWRLVTFFTIFWHPIKLDSERVSWYVYIYFFQIPQMWTFPTVFILLFLQPLKKLSVSETKMGWLGLILDFVHFSPPLRGGINRNTSFGHIIHSLFRLNSDAIYLVQMIEIWFVVLSSTVFFKLKCRKDYKSFLYPMWT